MAVQGKSGVGKGQKKDGRIDRRLEMGAFSAVEEKMFFGPSAPKRGKSRQKPQKNAPQEPLPKASCRFFLAFFGFENTAKSIPEGNRTIVFRKKKKRKRPFKMAEDILIKSI
jgi:hypothetical protein